MLAVQREQDIAVQHVVVSKQIQCDWIRQYIQIRSRYCWIDVVSKQTRIKTATSSSDIDVDEMKLT